MQEPKKKGPTAESYSAGVAAAYRQVGLPIFTVPQKLSKDSAYRRLGIAISTLYDSRSRDNPEQRVKAAMGVFNAFVKGAGEQYSPQLKKDFKAAVVLEEQAHRDAKDSAAPREPASHYRESKDRYRKPHPTS